MTVRLITESLGYLRVRAQALQFFKDHEDEMYLDLLRLVRVSEKTKDKNKITNMVADQDCEEKMFNMIRLGVLDYTLNQEYVTTVLGKEITRRIYGI